MTDVRRLRHAVGLGATASLAVGIAAAASATVGWQRLPRAPIAGRLGAAVAWTGRELVVAGGVTRRANGTTSAATDAAAYDPEARRWRRLAAPPAGVGAGAVWTGSTLVVWTGNGPRGPVGAVYDRRTNAWRRLPAGPLGAREGNVDVWTGTELLVIGGYSGDAFAAPVAAAVDPSTGRWRALHGLYGLTLFGAANGAVWTGREAIVAGNLSLCPEQGSACGHSRPIVVAYDPARDRMRELRPPASLGARLAASLTPLASTGRTVIFRAVSGRSLRVVAYAPPAARWRIGPAAPCPLAHGPDTQTVWIGDRVAAPYGAGGLQVYDPATSVWRRLATGASPLNTRAGSAAVWTGEQLVVWSGRAFRRFNPTPADGAAISLPR